MAPQSVAHSQSVAAFIPELELLIAEAMDEWKIPGLAITVVQNGEVALVRAYGLRDVEAGLKVTTDTQFLIGSVTKSFTSTGLALLMDERRIDWTKPVRDYIPEFRLHDAVATDRITTVLRRLSGERCEVGAQVAFDQPGLLPSEGAALAFGNVVSSCRYSASQGAVSAGARRQSLSPRAALPADPSAMTRRTRPHNFWTGSKRRCRAEAFSNTTGGAPRSSKRAASRHP
jgi:hypothetical protein